MSSTKLIKYWHIALTAKVGAFYMQIFQKGLIV